MSADFIPPTEADAELLPAGSQVGEYVLAGLLGAGGFARVYRARHPVLGTEVAVKVITRALALDADASQRFMREALAASRIGHPGVVRVLGYGKLADGRAYQVMELVNGPALDDHLDAGERLPVDEALRLLDAIAAALHAAHEAGILHRDLKPANILLEPDPDGPIPRLTDFGIAKALEAEETPHLTRTGTTLGTPAYMSPEQALGRPVGRASDVYSFGVVAFELITGQPPYQGTSPLEIMMQHVQAEPPVASALVPALGPRFDAPLARLLAKHPDDRPASVDDAMRALRGDAPPAPTGPPPGRLRIALAASLVAAVAVAAIWWARGSSSTPAVGPAFPAPATPPLVVEEADAPSSTPIAPRPAVVAGPPPDAAIPTSKATPARPPRARPPPATPPPADPPSDPAGADSMEIPPDYSP